MLQSLPVDMLEEYHIEATKAIAVKDKPMLDGLEKGGSKFEGSRRSRLIVHHLQLASSSIHTLGDSSSSTSATAADSKSFCYRRRSTFNC